jgi:sulfur-oxidizing protein SoxY
MRGRGRSAMTEALEEAGVNRREMLGTLGMLSVAAAAGGAVSLVAAPARAQTLGQNETVEAGLARVFGGRPMKDGAAMIKLDVPLIAENGSVVPVTVEVNAPMTPQSYVKSIYVVADRNRIPIVTRVALTPEAGKAYMGANIRLGETGDVRAIVEQSDGTLWQLKREVKVTVGGCGG